MTRNEMYRLPPGEFYLVKSDIRDSHYYVDVTLADKRTRTIAASPGVVAKDDPDTIEMPRENWSARITLEHVTEGHRLYDRACAWFMLSELGEPPAEVEDLA